MDRTLYQVNCILVSFKGNNSDPKDPITLVVERDRDLIMANIFAKVGEGWNKITEVNEQSSRFLIIGNFK